MSEFEDLRDFDDSDDITTGFESGGALSVAEIERRQDEFISEVDARINMLKRSKQYSAEERIAAARWLGESGVVDAVEPLVIVYQRDKTPGMREAAAYALGQFKAIEEGLDDSSTRQDVADMLDRIVLFREFGKPAPMRAIRMRQVGLLVSFVVFIGIGLLLLMQPNATERELAVTADAATAIALQATEFAELGVTATLSPTPTPTVTPTPDTIGIQVQLVSEYANSINTDADNLRVQFGEIGRNGPGTQDCELSFNQPAPLTLSSVGQQSDVLVEIVALLNELKTAVDDIIVNYNRSCTNPAGLTERLALDFGSEAVGVQGTIVPVQQTLSAIDPDAVQDAATAPQATAPAGGDESTLEATTEEAESALDFGAARTEIQALQRIIDNMNGLRQPAPTMVQYWQDVQNSGSSAGCNQPQPVVPEDYTVPLAIAQQVPEIAQAASAVNIGLQALRDNVTAFYNGCAAGNLAAQASNRLSQAQVAQTAFNDAQDVLILAQDAVR